LQGALPNLVERDILVAFAGPIAEAIYTRKSQFYVLMSGGAGDWTDAKQSLGLIPAGARASMKELAISRAGRLVRNH
jgi:hypothetical protein